MKSWLKVRLGMPITGKPMAVSLRFASLPFLLSAALAWVPAPASAQGQAKDRAAATTSAATGAPADEAAGLFEEIEFGGTLVIEGKVEKPQVQFTLLKEPPPEKEIRFETSFLQSLLKHERENTFRP